MLSASSADHLLRAAFSARPDWAVRRSQFRHHVGERHAGALKHDQEMVEHVRRLGGEPGPVALSRRRSPPRPPPRRASWPAAPARRRAASRCRIRPAARAARSATMRARSVEGEGGHGRRSSLTSPRPNGRGASDASRQPRGARAGARPARRGASAGRARPCSAWPRRSCGCRNGRSRRPAPRSHGPSRTPSTRWSRSPTPPEAITGTGHASAIARTRARS